MTLMTLLDIFVEESPAHLYFNLPGNLVKEIPDQLKVKKYSARLTSLGGILCKYPCRL